MSANTRFAQLMNTKRENWTIADGIYIRGWEYGFAPTPEGMFRSSDPCIEDWKAGVRDGAADREAGRYSDEAERLDLPLRNKT